MTSTSDSDTTLDAFLGGRLTLEQPRKGYRAGVDPVLLAAAVKARSGQSVLELGCGAGAALLCLGTRVEGLTLHGVEVQEDYAALCRANATANGIDAQVWTADLTDLPADLRGMSFDHVIANPPYFHIQRRRAALDAGREVAFAGATSMDRWLDTAFRRLRPKGWLTLIQHIERLPEILSGLDDRFGAVAVTPISGRVGRAPDRFLLKARKGGLAPFRLSAPLILHNGPEHLQDAEDYRPEIQDVLRHGKALDLPD